MVRRKGKNVQNLNVGDRVFLFGGGSFSTVVTTSAQLCQRIPEALSFDDAATMPCVYGTAIYCLLNIGNLMAGEVCTAVLFLFLPFSSFFLGDLPPIPDPVL